MSGEWYFVRDGESIGPLSFNALRELARQKKLSKADYVSHRGLGQWIAAGTVGDLFEPEGAEPDAVSRDTSATPPDQSVVIDGHRLVIGQHDVDLRGITGIDVTRRIPGNLTGAYIAFGWSLYMYLHASFFAVCLAVCVVAVAGGIVCAPVGCLAGLLTVPDALRFFVGAICCLLGSSGPGLFFYALFCLLVLPATDIWNLDKGEYLLTLVFPTESRTVAVSDQRREIVDLATKIRLDTSSAVQIRFNGEEPGWVRFLRAYLPLFNRSAAMMLGFFRHLKQKWGRKLHPSRSS